MGILSPKVRDLRELARLYSIQTTYTDAAGRNREAPKESILAALKMRIPAGTDLSAALEERRRTLGSRPIEPVTVVWGKRRPIVDLQLPEHLGDGAIRWRLQLEDGTVREGGGRDTVSHVRPGSVAGFVRRRVLLPDFVPLGYHLLTMSIGSFSAETLVIAAPVKARGPKDRSWGVFLPLYAARSGENWGAGDLGDMRAFHQWVQELGGGVVATLPLLAAFEDEPSPYSPVSRLFWNEMYLDLQRLPEWSDDLRPDSVMSELQALDQVDYVKVSAARRKVLERMTARFSKDDEFFEFARHGAFGYAHFRAAREDRDSADYHLYVQYRMAQQMRAFADETRRDGVGLYLDFPLGVNPAGYDAWKHERAFAKGVSVGAPPDLFFTKGQNWGFRPLDPDAIREQHYDYFRSCISHHVSHAGMLRLDHVMGLHRLFWIPDGGEAKDGVYVNYQAEELYAIVVLEAERHGCVLVGEDLGTVPPVVPRMMKRHGLRRMHVVQYEINPEGEDPAGTPPKEAVASINTHDMPTFAGFWSGRDIDERVELELLDEKGAAEERRKRQQMRQALTHSLKARGLLSEESADTKAVLEGVLRSLSASSAEIVLVNVEDLWLETRPQNVPGVPDKSWKQKFRRTLDEMRRDPEIVRVLAAVNQERRRGVHGRET